MWKKYASDFFACSNKAGQFMFGSIKNLSVIPNAIEVEKFRYSDKIRNNIRQEMGISDKFVIGHIGRFNLQKNHMFVLNIFEKIHEKNPSAVLLLIGEGELEDKIRKEIGKKKLENFIMILGIRKDVNLIYQAMDVFILPSLFEGLPVTGIEAQASGLPCFFSDVITDEIGITNNSHFISLDRENQWINSILEINDRESNDRGVYFYLIRDSKFNVKNSAKILEKMYLNFYSITEEQKI
jgi:glycosyltransferase involved in cell wall biosynthesis